MSVFCVLGGLFVDKAARTLAIIGVLVVDPFSASRETAHAPLPAINDSSSTACDPIDRVADTTAFYRRGPHPPTHRGVYIMLIAALNPL